MACSLARMKRETLVHLKQMEKLAKKFKQLKIVCVDELTDLFINTSISFGCVKVASNLLEATVIHPDAHAQESS